VLNYVAFLIVLISSNLLRKIGKPDKTKEGRKGKRREGNAKEGRREREWREAGKEGRRKKKERKEGI
jgi:hypothetical protein